MWYAVRFLRNLAHKKLLTLNLLENSEKLSIFASTRLNNMDKCCKKLPSTMIPIFDLSHRFKKSMLEITSNAPLEVIWKYIDPLQTEKLPKDITFKVIAGKKHYDVIRYYGSREKFYSQKVIDILAQFVDMTDKCYPIEIEGIVDSYYSIYNLKAYHFFNRKVEQSMYDPKYYDIEAPSIPIFSIEDTTYLMVSEEVKNALVKNKVTNIELIEGFGCSREEYEMIKKSKFVPEVHVYRDK